MMKEPGAHGETVTRLSPEDVFALDPSIRWAGLASAGRVIFCQMRPGVESLTPEADDRLLLELRAQYIGDICHHVSRWARPPEYSVMSYQKFIEFIILLNDEYLVTLEKNVTPLTLQEIDRKVRDLAGRQ